MTDQNLALLIEGRRAVGPEGDGKRIREDAGLSLADMGEMVGVSYVTILRWEQGARRPALEPAVKYAKALNRLERVLQHTRNGR